jgi:hypothetical protein
MNTKEVPKPNHNLEDRVSKKQSFADLAEQLRTKCKAKKSDLKRGEDATYYSKVLNGHIIPGWSGYPRTNLGRLEVKKFIRTLIENAQLNSAGITVEDADNLLLNAEYAPLDIVHNSDDAALVEQINSWQKKNGDKKSQTLAISDSFYISELSTPLREALDKEIQARFMAHIRSLNPDLGQATKDQRVEFILAPSGSEESNWYRQARIVAAANEGPALSYTHYISSFAIPATVRDRYASTRGWDEKKRQQYLNGRNSRFKEWENQVKKYPHHIIYEEGRLTQELSKGLFREIAMVNAEELEDQVETLCRYLDQYPQLQIGITKRELNFQFEVKADRIVLIQGMREQPFTRYMNVLSWIVEEDRFVRVFKQLFDSVWSEALTDKEQVKAWFRGHLNKRS